VYVYAIRRVQINQKSWKLLHFSSWLMLMMMVVVVIMMMIVIIIIIIIKFQRVEEFKYLGTTLTNKNSIL
jgi:type IV secretory pathway component VirB8